jgi:hypothetical protein
MRASETGRNKRSIVTRCFSQNGAALLHRAISLFGCDIDHPFIKALVIMSAHHT